MIVRQSLARLRASTVVVICLLALVCAGATSAGAPGRLGRGRTGAERAGEHGERARPRTDGRWAVARGLEGARPALQARDFIVTPAGLR